MKKIKTFVGAAICRPWIFLLALLLGSCTLLRGEVPEPPGHDGPVLTRRNIELLVWAEPGGEEAFILAAAAEFTRRYPNISVRTETFGTPDIVRRARSAPEAGGTADLFALPHMEVRGFAEALLILPARDQSKTQNSVFPACAQAATVGGVIFGYPVSAETVALFYNRRFVTESELPSTWDELIAFANAFNDGDRLGFVMPVGSPYAAATFISAKNNRPFEPGGEDNLRTAAALEGMEVFRRLKGAVGLSSEELSDAAVETMFAQGRAALCMGGPWNIARFTGAGIDFGVAPLPAFAGDEPSASLAFARVMAVSAHSEWPDEASAFADMLITEEMQRLRVELTGELPSVDMELRSPAYVAGFTAQMRDAFAAVSAPAAAGFWDLFGQAAARIWDGGNVQTELGALSEGLRPPAEEPDADDNTE
jgi:arabinogalactan oligomer/maltooligosaccharide transport system substrate-binding protein